MTFEIYNYVFVLVGIFTIWATVTKPVFYWESRRAERMRDLIGDRATEIMYYIIGGFCLFIGILSILGLVELF